MSSGVGGSTGLSLLVIGTGDEPPGDWQQPVPTQRLTVAPGARFCVILEGCPAPKEQADEWLDLAERLLRRAVAELGFGAYTRAGLGLEAVGVLDAAGEGGQGVAACGASATPATTPIGAHADEAPATDDRYVAHLSAAELQARLADGTWRRWGVEPTQVTENYGPESGGITGAISIIGTATPAKPPTAASTSIHVPRRTAATMPSGIARMIATSMPPHASRSV